MTRKLGLPVTQPGDAAVAGGVSATPRVDQVRARLGGRATTEAGAGSIVSLPGAERLGVVLFARGNERDVMLLTGLVHRTRDPLLEAPPGAAPPELLALATDARRFATLVEGQRVRFQDPLHGLAEGRLVEKCRWGALVLRDDETVLGVGFGRIWPLQSAEPHDARGVQ